jgi:hypothetical protein
MAQKRPGFHEMAGTAQVEGDPFPQRKEAKLAAKTADLGAMEQSAGIPQPARLLLRSPFSGAMRRE